MPNPRGAWTPSTIIIDESIAEHATTHEICSRCAGATTYLSRLSSTESDEDLLRRVVCAVPMDQGALSRLARSTLLLYSSGDICHQMAAGSVASRRCFNFLKLTPYAGVCRAECSYCWFKDPVLIPKINVTFFDHLPVLLRRFSRETNLPMVFTFTHYKTDCFSIEHLTGFVHRLVEVFERETQFHVQFLTKLDNVDALLLRPPTRGSIVCFSVNAVSVARDIELGTSSVEQRLQAAGNLAKCGVPVLLRIDPLLAFGGWEEQYRELVGLILQHVTPLHITLGTPRYQDDDELARMVSTTRSNKAAQIMKKQAALMGHHKPGSPERPKPAGFQYYFKNMPISYPRELRAALYRNVIEHCWKLDPSIPIGLCEEPVDVWDDCGLSWCGDSTRDCSCGFVPQNARSSEDESIRK